MFSWSRQDSSVSSTQPNRFENSSSQRLNKYSRKEHVESYVNDSLLKPSTRSVTKDEVFETVFLTKKSNVLILRVHLAPSLNELDIPLPSMSLVGVRADHPWIDSSMRVIGYKKIMSKEAWSASGLLLGIVVKDVLQHLQLNPPKILDITDPRVKKIQPSVATSKPDDPKDDSLNMKQPSSSITLPPSFDQYQESQLNIPSSMHSQIDGALSSDKSNQTIPNDYPELNSLTKQELEQLDIDKELLLQFIEKLAFVQTCMSQKISLEIETTSKAQNNLGLQDRLCQLLDEVSTLQKSLKEKIELHKSLNHRITELTKPVDVHYVLDQLHKGKRASFVESEKLAKNPSRFVNELESFIQLRTLHHLQSAKIECLQDNLK